MSVITGLSRRDFIKYSAIAVTVGGLGALIPDLGGLIPGKLIQGNGSASSIAHPLHACIETNPSYPIDSTVVKTTTRILSFPMPAMPSSPNSGAGLHPTELPLISEYDRFGYGKYTFGEGLPIVPRYDIMPKGYANANPTRLKQFSNFFAITDVHITDKESPLQLIYLQQEDPVYASTNTSLYSPIMPYTTHVLDAAVQTINALHAQNPFMFGICLGDAANSSQFNELRWFIDVMDGKVITPSSGSHAGAGTIDYQTPYKAAGLDPSIPWYSVLGNHDHFFIGSAPVDGDPSLGLREAFTGSTVFATGDGLVPLIQQIKADPEIFPTMYDLNAAIKRTFYMGVIDGSTPDGNIIDAGETASIGPAPTVVPDPDRRPLLKAQWVQEFFNTTSDPTGHGFNLTPLGMGEGFACYSFIPNPQAPLKIIVLDDTQSETDGSHDVHGHAYLDMRRWEWLKDELAAGQASNQLMIIAAHIPIGVAAIGEEVEWWESSHDPYATEQNAATLAELVAELQNAPNMLMWIAGHRHVNTVKAFVSPDTDAPEKGFWQVETTSLRDFPQQFRTFEIYLNSDYSISIVTINVDPAVAPGTPAAKSRFYAIAAEQIVQNDKLPNTRNTLHDPNFHIPVASMDPSRKQSDDTALNLDPTIVYGSVPDVPYCASYNCELFKQLSPTMIKAMQTLFPERDTRFR